jgi:hypothetical protein
MAETTPVFTGNAMDDMERFPTVDRNRLIELMTKLMTTGFRGSKQMVVDGLVVDYLQGSLGNRIPPEAWSLLRDTIRIGKV